VSLKGLPVRFCALVYKKAMLLDVSAPRGSFTLHPGENPVVLLSAGVGATPVTSMLHALAAERSQRQVWWIYGARDRVNHPAEESHSLLKELSLGRSYILYANPGRPMKWV
jgi:ferredoxin-NADP reductase